MFCGDKVKYPTPEHKALAVALNRSPFLFRTMTKDSSFVDDALKKYTYVGPVPLHNESYDVTDLYKKLKKILAKNGIITQEDINDSLAILEK